MQRNHHISIAQRNLSKSKKYYSYRTLKKDSENIVSHDINDIVQKLCMSQKLAHSSLLLSRKKSPLSVIDLFRNHQSALKPNPAVNSSHFFEHDQHQIMMQKALKKQILYYISKIKQPLKTKCSLYQEYLALSQETSDYLEYYLTNFTGEDPARATDLLKEEGKTIILLILRKKYKCFLTNYCDINNRIFLSFNLNPMNEFQFVSWEKFMRIRKLISGDFNRKDCADFLLGYFFTEPKKLLAGSEFWLILTSVFRKLGGVLDSSHLEILISRIKQSLVELIPEDKELSEEAFHKIILKQSMFIWSQFVTLVFL